MALTPAKSAVDDYERWLKTQCAVVPGALARKRKAMAEGAFAFLRATSFRFAAQIQAMLPGLATATMVPSCGDAHTANFGTWRDAEGRLAWGVNDLDDCAMLPWPIDLVRLATSALLLPDAPRAGEAGAAVLTGYAGRLRAPRGFVLDEDNADLRAFVSPDAAARRKFWAKVDALPSAEPPAEWQVALLADLPASAALERFAAREAGLGGLGRPRFVAIAQWRGGRVVREAKARVPGAWFMARFPQAGPLDPATLLACPGRVPDPWLVLHPGFVVRRLAPDSDKLSPPKGDAAALLTLLEAMGGELANLHASGGQAAAVSADLRRRPPAWLHDASKEMAATVTADWRDFAA